jgi:DNA-directed RNA polymerase sigma subunit (sigma70/sigma32)
MDPADHRPDGTPRYEAADELAALLATAGLTAREHQALTLAFGLLDGRHRTGRQVARTLGISPARAQQLLQQALRRLRRAAGVQEDATEPSRLKAGGVEAAAATA